MATSSNKIRQSTNNHLKSSSTVVRQSHAKYSTSSKVTLSKTGVTNSAGNLKSKQQVFDVKRSDISVIVRDRNGEDATPLSLAFSKAKLENSNDNYRENVVDLLGNLESAGSVNSVDNNTSLKKSSAFGESGQVLSQQESSVDDHHSVADELDGIRDSVSSRVDTGPQLRGINMEPRVQEIDPTKYSSIRLSETNTFVFLDLPSICVSSESLDEASLVKSQNAKYKELKAINQNNDNYISRGMQTVINPTKTKDAQAYCQKSVNAAIMVNEWAIYDALQPLQVRPSSPDEQRKEIDLESKLKELEVNESQRVQDRSQSIMQSTATSTIVFETNSEHGMDESQSQLLQKPSSNMAQKSKPKDELLTLNTESVLEKLALVERAIVGNSYEKKVIMFRNVPDDGMIEQKRVEAFHRSNEENEHEEELRKHDESKKTEDYAVNVLPTLTLLWNYKCELTRGRPITCISLNKQNEDIIAISYGESRFIHEASPGLILCWTTKNPEWPDRIYHTDSPCVAIDFSRMNPGLLAAGFMDGHIAIYNTKLNKAKEILDW